MLMYLLFTNTVGAPLSITTHRCWQFLYQLCVFCDRWWIYLFKCELILVGAVCFVAVFYTYGQGIIWVIMAHVSLVYKYILIDIQTYTASLCHKPISCSPWPVYPNLISQTPATMYTYILPDYGGSDFIHVESTRRRVYRISQTRYFRDTDCVRCCICNFDIVLLYRNMPQKAKILQFHCNDFLIGISHMSLFPLLKLISVT